MDDDTWTLVKKKKKDFVNLMHRATQTVNHFITLRHTTPQKGTHT